MTTCNHNKCPHGHWSTHRHCQVPECPYVEKTGSRQGDFVDGKFVCPAHSTVLGREAASAAFLAEASEKGWP